MGWQTSSSVPAHMARATKSIPPDRPLHIPTDPNGSQRIPQTPRTLPETGTEHPKPRDSLRPRVGSQPRHAPVARTVQPDPWHRGMVSRACQNWGRVHYRFRMYIGFWPYSMCPLHSLESRSFGAPSVGHRRRGRAGAHTSSAVTGASSSGSFCVALRASPTSSAGIGADDVSR